MHVLQLVTNDEAPFFRQQVDSLAKRGVSCDISTPGGSHSSTETRSFREYVRMTLDTARVDPSSYDLIHANYGLTGPAALLQPNIPTVLSLWGSDLYGRFGPLSRICARGVDEVIVMSDDMAKNLNMPCYVIPHGIDFDRFEPIPRQAAREELGWSQSEHHILFPYSPDRTIKDFPKASRVVAAVNREYDTPINLQTVSDVEHERMYLYYNAANAVLFTSKREGSPNVVREALACNVPVVATAVGDVAQYLESVPAGAVCSSEPELIDAVSAALQRERPSNARSAVAETSAQAVGDRLYAVYQKAVSERSTQAEPFRQKPEQNAEQ